MSTIPENSNSTPGLQRSRSTTSNVSMRSTVEGHTSPPKPSTPINQSTATLILNTRKYIQSILSKNSTTKPTYIDALSKVLVNMNLIQTAHEEEAELLDNARTSIRNLEEKNDALREAIHTVSRHFPSSNDLKSLVVQSIQVGLEEVRNTITELNNIKEYMMSSATQNTETDKEPQQPTVDDSQTTQKTFAQRTAATPPRPTNQSSEEGHPAKCTLVIKSLKKAPGRVIMRDLQNIKITVPGGVIKNIKTSPTSVEITCTSENNKNILKQELKQIQAFDKDHLINDKPVPLHKIILLSVSTHYEADDIKDYLTQHFKLNPDEIQILSKLTNRRSNRHNWIILSPLNVAKQLVQEDGLYIGPSFSRIRPHTTIQRCRNCQFIGHSERKCSNQAACIHCGTHHDNSSECTKPKACINCMHYNKNYNCNYNTSHPASDIRCPVYDRLYSAERAKIDAIFGLNHSSIPPAPPPPLGEEHYPVFPQWSYRRPSEIQQRIPLLGLHPPDINGNPPRNSSDPPSHPSTAAGCPGMATSAPFNTT